MSGTAEQMSGVHALLERWRAGDTGSRDALLARVYPVMRRWALAYVLDRDEAEDVAQEAAIVVYRKIGQYRAEASFTAWLYRITARTAGQRRRRTARRRRLGAGPRTLPEVTMYQTDPGARVDGARLGAVMRALYEGLPPRQRAVMGLVDFEGFTPAEAAEMMGLAPGTLRVNLFKARASMRRRLLAAVPGLADRLARVPDPEAEDA